MCEWVMEAKAPMVVITGGEPAMHPLEELVAALHEIGVEVNIETSGTHPLNAKLDWVCLSPKRFRKCKEEFYSMADELKVVIFHENDLRWAEQHAALVNLECQLYLQPEWSVREQITPAIIEYVKNNPRWAISLQIHKYLGVD
jgi:organic radical activating enzyme